MDSEVRGIPPPVFSKISDLHFIVFHTVGHGRNFRKQFRLPFYL